MSFMFGIIYLFANSSCGVSRSKKMLTYQRSHHYYEIMIQIKDKEATFGRVMNLLFQSGLNIISIEQVPTYEELQGIRINVRNENRKSIDNFQNLVRTNLSDECVWIRKI